MFRIKRSTKSTPFWPKMTKKTPLITGQRGSVPRAQNFPFPLIFVWACNHIHGKSASPGPQQKTPKEWQRALQSPSFKTALFRFLAFEWEKDIYAAILSDHSVHIGLDNKCYKFEHRRGSVQKVEVSELASCHEEADTRLIFHINHVLHVAPAASISVRSNDADVLILLIYHMAKYQNKPKVWIDMGLSSNNTQRYISITKLVESLEQSTVDALPGIHAFTG